ncbi:putative integral membrane protein [Janibacter sp. HTCC2649]|uniref:hypothetical protein n=1 Tax=Janibacter sp. HTCC2649 TaxID=313589 RepID=UPI00006718DB|nr:hypothetical protein [Janibacter sp. HTCC2649]EAP98351.1 putative integral membrane protein [Janibacter sp. HTCC2649]
MTTASTRPRHRTTSTLVPLTLRVVVALSLLVDAAVHLRLAHGYQQSAPSGIGAGNLFRIQAVLALAVAAWVLLRGGRPALISAFAIGLSALAAVVLYRYVDIPALGPLPAMYEPVWFFEKSLSAVFEGLAALAALAALTLRSSRTR